MSIADCRAGICPCSRPEYPGDDHTCPPDPRSVDEREADREHELNRPCEPWEGETAVSLRN
jgi:hypothetical protein